jgi:hypothetical protein
VVLYPLQLLGRVQLQRVAAHPRVPQVAAAGGGCTCQTDQCTAIAHKCALVLSLHVCRAFVPVQLVRKARLRAALPAFCGASLVHQPASSHAWLSLPAHTSWPAISIVDAMLTIDFTWLTGLYSPVGQDMAFHIAFRSAAGQAYLFPSFATCCQFRLSFLLSNLSGLHVGLALLQLLSSCGLCPLRLQRCRCRLSLRRKLGLALSSRL